jgi:hypothetical protein
MGIKADLNEITVRVQMDLRDLSAKVTELRAHIASLPEDGPVIRCDPCFITFRSEARLAEHRYHHHAGPVPEHWLEAEGRSAA